MMFGGGMLLGWLLPLILLVLAGMWLFNNSASNRRDGTNLFNNQRTEKTPDEILKERYARGEISHEEYEEMRQTLKH